MCFVITTTTAFLVLIISVTSSSSFTISTHSSSSCSTSYIDQSGGIVYRTGIVQSKQEWDSIYTEVLSVLPLLQPETKSSIAQKRYGIALHPQSSSTIVQILQNPTSSITKFVNKIGSTIKNKDKYPCTTAIVSNDMNNNHNVDYDTNNENNNNNNNYNYILAPDIPVEIRSYEKFGSGMNWHVDDVLYHPIPQIEIILTIINTSNCQTMWETTTTTPSSNSKVIHSVETDPNSILCLRAGGVSHCVTNLQYGKRIIIKCAYIPYGNNQQTITTYCRGNTATSTTTKHRKNTNNKQQQQKEIHTTQHTQFQSITKNISKNRKQKKRN